MRSAKCSRVVSLAQVASDVTRRRLRGKQCKAAKVSAAEQAAKVSAAERAEQADLRTMRLLLSASYLVASAMLPTLSWGGEGCCDCCRDTTHTMLFFYALLSQSSRRAWVPWCHCKKTRPGRQIYTGDKARAQRLHCAACCTVPQEEVRQK